MFFFTCHMLYHELLLPQGVQWLSKENLMSRLIDLLAPTYSPDMHTVVSELIKGIISMAAPSPGAGVADSNVPPSNRFARELAHRDSVTKLASYILCDFGPTSSGDEPTVNDTAAAGGSNTSSTRLVPEYAASSVVQSICIIIELIRQNNSDYFEPYLFHTLRNRLIQVQQHLQMTKEGGREELETAMKEMVNRMGVVHLGPVLEIMCDKLDQLQQYLSKPRSLVRHIVLSMSCQANRPTNHVGWSRPDDCWRAHPVDLRAVPHMRTLRRVVALLKYVALEPAKGV